MISFPPRLLDFNCVWRVDWDDAETDLSHITAGSSNVGTNPSGSNAGGVGQDSLWEDNWDDDDIEDDFSKQLRFVVKFLETCQWCCSFVLFQS